MKIIGPIEDFQHKIGLVAAVRPYEDGYHLTAAFWPKEIEPNAWRYARSPDGMIHYLFHPGEYEIYGRVVQ